MYADSMTVAAARDQYFAENGFTLAGYTDRWVKLFQLGPIPVGFPNTAGRVAAVRLHDLHHVATGYRTTFTGESEIGAWEVGAGCGKYYAAWALNLSALGVGMLFAPRRVFRAFVRGRRSKSLYDRVFGEDLLAMEVGALRKLLHIDREPSATVTGGDVVRFAGWLAASIGILLVTVSPLVIPLVWLAL